MFIPVEMTNMFIIGYISSTDNAYYFPIDYDRLSVITASFAKCSCIGKGIQCIPGIG